jgi:hypothetical protein
MTFLRNHRDAIAAMDFFVVATITFRVLYIWFAIEHGRRRIVHFHVTDHPDAAWVAQQLPRRSRSTPLRVTSCSTATAPSPRTSSRW